MVAMKGSEMLAQPYDDSIMELSLMMSRSQFDVLAQRASSQGVSVAQFLRRLVHESTAEASNAKMAD